MRHPPLAKKQSATALNLPAAMATKKKPIPPEDVIHEDSEPPITEVPEPRTVEVDIDDAQIDEPKDDAFRKAPQPVKAQKRRKKA